MVLGIS